ncbi:MAG: ANTAR domain-containing protein [Propionibacteriaceae bacterium]|nr:MAG: ANTAR domain-containing protein [Propionibacteriaceae bacterium]
MTTGSRATPTRSFTPCDNRGVQVKQRLWDGGVGVPRPAPGGTPVAARRLIRSRWSPADFALLVHEPTTEVGRLQRGAELVVALVDGCDHAGVTVLTPHFMETVAASDDVVRRGDGWQHALSEGPGLDSVRDRATVVSQDVAIDPRWRSWGPRVATDLGVRSVASVLLDHRGTTLGSLTLYADRPDAWDEGQDALVRTLAGQLALAGAGARVLDHREQSLVARVGMGQAQGIVMERFGMTADQAAEHLRRLALSTQLSLVHLSEVIVETREVPQLRVREGDARG